MSGQSPFSRHFGIVALTASMGIVGQGALAAQELRYLRWSDHVHETNLDAARCIVASWLSDKYGKN